MRCLYAMRLVLSQRYGRRRVSRPRSRNRDAAMAFAVVVKSAGARLYGALLVGLMIFAGVSGSSRSTAGGERRNAQNPSPTAQRHQ